MAKHFRMEIHILWDLNTDYVFFLEVYLLYYIGWFQAGDFLVNMIFHFDQLWQNMIEEHRAICESKFFF